MKWIGHSLDDMDVCNLQETGVIERGSTLPCGSVLLTQLSSIMPLGLWLEARAASGAFDTANRGVSILTYA
jgi:hypothetical protein